MRNNNYLKIFIMAIIWVLIPFVDEIVILALLFALLFKPTNKTQLVV